MSVDAENYFSIPLNLELLELLAVNFRVAYSELVIQEDIDFVVPGQIPLIRIDPEDNAQGEYFTGPDEVPYQRYEEDNVCMITIGTLAHCMEISRNTSESDARESSLAIQSMLEVCCAIIPREMAHNISLEQLQAINSITLQKTFN